jgi:hypothetical protein
MGGDTTFFNLTKFAVAADTMTFQAGSTQTVAGKLTLEGASLKRLLSLRASVAGSQWRIDPRDAAFLQFLDVQDSDALASLHAAPIS